MTEVEFRYMKDSLAGDLAVMLASDNGLSITEALDFLYNSVTYSKLSDRRTGLYIQSPKYIYSFLKTEFATGKIA